MNNKRKLSFWLVGYSILILMVGTNIPSPLYSVYKTNWGFSPLVLTLIFATYALMLIPSLVLFGKISDQFGRKKIIWLGVVMSIIGSFLFIFAKSVLWLFMARVFQGLAVGILSGAATAALIELNPSKNKNLGAFVTSLATAGGTALGPLLGGIIAQYGHDPLVTPYVAHLILTIPSMFGILFIKETVVKSQQNKDKSKNKGLPENLKQPFIASAITAFIAWSVTALFMSIVPSYVSTLLHIKNLALIGGVVFLMLGSSVFAQIVFKKLSHSVSMKSGSILLTIGLISIVITVPLQSIFLLLIGTIISGIGQGLAFKGSMELVNIIAPVDQRGVLVSKLYIVIYLGVGLPIIGVGTLAVMIGLFKAILIFACIIGCISSIMVSIGFNKLSNYRHKGIHKYV